MESINNALNKCLKEIKLEDKKQKVISTGFCNLDYLIRGINRGNLIIMASRPAMGKTTLAFNIATNVAIREKIPIAIFSLEMAKETVVNRIICSEARIDINKIRIGNLEEADWTRLANASNTLSEAKIFIDDSPAISINEIEVVCRKLKKEQNIGLIVIDYLQLVQETNIFNNEQRIAKINNKLKKISIELNIAIIATCQLPRGIEKRKNKRPKITDLAYRGTSYNDADAIIFLYMDDYYNVDSEKKNIAEVIVARNRYGDTGTIELEFLKNYFLFVNLERKIKE